MNCFLVVSESLDTHTVQQAFPSHCYDIEADAWVVAGPQATCADICQVLGVGPGGKRGVVAKMDEYYGFFDRALWDKIVEWRDLP